MLCDRKSTFFVILCDCDPGPLRIERLKKEIEDLRKALEDLAKSQGAQLADMRKKAQGAGKGKGKGRWLPSTEEAAVEEGERKVQNL